MKTLQAVLIMMLCAWSALAAAPAHAFEPDEALSDPALEARARALSAELRCVVCQNQSIDESDAPLAKDLRILVREHLVAGATDQQVIDFLVARYGEFILLKPRLSKATALLWLTPVLILLLAAGAVLSFVWTQKKQVNQLDTTLTEEEQAALKKILSTKA